MNVLTQLLNQPGLGDQAGGVVSGLLQQSGGPEAYEAAFQKSVVDPAMMQYQQRVLPAIQQRFIDANAGSSSALNDALAQSAQDLTTQLGSQYGQFFQNQQQYDLARQGQGLGYLQNILNMRTFEPNIQQNQGYGGDLLKLASASLPYLASAASSEKVKENIRDYKKGLDIVKNMDVKLYDYIEQLGGYKDHVGVIAEKMPKEIQKDINGINSVDLYGLIGLLINSVKELSSKVEMLEAK